MSRNTSYRRWIAAALMLGSTFAVAADTPPPTYPVAGLAPYARPAGAPTIREFTVSSETLARWLHGIEGDRATGLGFLNNQGAWYTPFTHPGMPDYYDIRGWHRKPGQR